MASTSPFLHRSLCTEPDSLAILHLRRDLQLPVLLRAEDDADEGYKEGKVTNTRFGSFPHSTLIGVPWGSQVRASVVDTGSRGRKIAAQQQQQQQQQERKKRKREPEVETDDGSHASTPASGEEEEEEGNTTSQQQAVVTASTGFVHLLAPTPELWTLSLPHRTQVVYTPDYSYVLQKLRARPGCAIIEAGAGSGSFTHAAARAVYSGEPRAASSSSLGGRKGRVWSFEFHEQRAEELRKEVRDHGLDGTVHITHRDVYCDGFAVMQGAEQAVKADAIFLDLPAPWLALGRLSRLDDAPAPKPEPDDVDVKSGNGQAATPPRHRQQKSPLNPSSTVRICAFLPCIEQVQRTVSELQRCDWLDIEVVEIADKRIEVRRERVGVQEEGLRGVNPSPASVDEAVARLRDVERRTRAFHAESPADGPGAVDGRVSKQRRLAGIRDAQAERKLYREGRLVHRPEAELKTHTSYLVFALLPREWSAEDEAAAAEQWAVVAAAGVASPDKGTSNRQRRRDARAAAPEVPPAGPDAG